MQSKVLLLAFAIIAATLLAVASVDAGAHRCAKADCSDLIGEGLVKDNLGRAHHFTDRHHEDLEEHQRKERINLLRRGEVKPDW